MTSNARSEQVAGAPPVPSVAQASAELAAAVDCVQAADKFTAKAVRLLGRAARTGVCETVEGLPLDLLLTNVCRLINADRNILLTAADTLTHMPNLQRLFEAGEVSWGQVRNIARTCSRLSRDDRGVIDGRIAATVARWAGLDGFHPDELLHEVDVAVNRLRDPKDVETQEAYEQDATNFVAVQPRFDGGMRFHGQADPLTAAPILQAWETAASDLDSVEDHDPDTPRTRARRRFRGLLATANAYLAGGPNRRPRPSFNVIVDTRDIHVTAAGHLELRMPGCLPRLTARLTDLLATDADVQAVVFDGARPLAVSGLGSLRRGSETSGRTAPEHTFRRMRRKLLRSDLHVPGVPLRDNGTHHPENLVTLGKRAHLHHIHRRGWLPALDPDTGMLTVTRDGRTFRSLPRGTPLEPARDTGGPDPPG